MWDADCGANARLICGEHWSLLFFCIGMNARASKAKGKKLVAGEELEVNLARSSEQPFTAAMDCRKLPRASQHKFPSFLQLLSCFSFFEKRVYKNAIAKMYLLCALFRFAN